MSKLSIKDLDLKGKTLFMRVDFNVPLSPDGEITSDKRIRASLPSIQFALDQGCGLILASHLGRPKGKRNDSMSLRPVAAKLSELLQRPVAMAPDCVGPEVAAMRPAPGDVLLLENLRFHAEEEANDEAFSRALAAQCDLYANDAFGTAHRAHASTVGMTRFVSQAAAGFLMDKELEYLDKVTKSPERPCVAIIGGAKVSDKIEVIDNLLKISDTVLIGGAMAYTFLKSQGLEIGKSLVEEDKLELAASLLASAGSKLMLPVDHAVSDAFQGGVPRQEVDLIPADKMALDIGPKTIAAYEQVIAGAKTVIWNGPMGVFEMPPFDIGTMAVAHAIANSSSVSVVGGGDSEKAVKTAGLSSKMSHVSTGGGASLEFLSGLELPGVAALTNKE
jgi:phosphoglycerate kinase